MPSLAQARRGLALGAIAGLGVFRPPADAPPARRVTGPDLTGVSYRVQPDQGVSTPALAAGAARAALRAADVRPSDVEMIIVGTTSPDVLWPATACLVQTDLKLPMVASFDLYAAETSMLAALNVGARYVAAGARGVLVIGAESDNQLVDLPGQGAAVHGRAAAATVLTPAGGDTGILSTMVAGAARSDVNGDAQDRILLRGLAEGWSNGERGAGGGDGHRGNHLARPYHAGDLGSGQGGPVRYPSGAGVRSIGDAKQSGQRGRWLQAGGPPGPQGGAADVALRP